MTASLEHYIPPKELGKIERKQAAEAARRERVLNAKVRTIGIDKAGLDQQVAERQEIEAEKKRKELE